MMLDKHANLKYKVRQQALLVRGLLRLHRRAERGDDGEVHQGTGAH